MGHAPKKILLVLDDSSMARAEEPDFSSLDPVIDEAVSLAHENEAHLAAIFVMDATWNGYVGHDWLSGSGSRADFLDYIKEEEGKNAHETMRRFAQKSERLSSVDTIIAAGDVVEQVRAEMLKGYDLTIIPNPLRRGLELMRDGVERICQAAPCRVLLVPALKQ